MKKIDMFKEPFGILTVVSDLGTRKEKDGSYRRWYLCNCECGTQVDVRGKELRCGHKMSCGCLRVSNCRAIGKRNVKHGMLVGENKHYWSVWTGMKKRCEDERVHNYHRYGGRGIKVCERWEDFWLFLEDIKAVELATGRKLSKEFSLDRKNSNGNYDPENITLSTPKEQARNRHNNCLIHGKTLAELVEITGMYDTTIKRMAGKGATLEQILARTKIRIYPDV